ncbi:MAG: hypothetical protein OK439_00105 [Thaumarchaeota archaeon]|nr:hypothetical protein [Nitrososphaerota archaeon]
MKKLLVIAGPEDDAIARKIHRNISLSTLGLTIDRIQLGHDESLSSTLLLDKDSSVLLPIISLDTLAYRWATVDLLTFVSNIDYEVFPLIYTDKDWETLQEKIPEEFRLAINSCQYILFRNDRFEDSITELLRILSPQMDSEAVYSEAQSSDNPFRRVRMEHYESLQLLAQNFAEPERARYDKIMEVKPTILQGGRGCGKSMILKSMQASVAVYRRATAKSFKDLKIGYFGIYCRMTQGSFSTQEGNIEKHIDQDAATRLFSTELILQLAQSLIEEVRVCSTRNILEITRTQETKIAVSVANILSPGDSAADFQTLEQLIQTFLRAINDYLGSKILGDAPVYEGIHLSKEQLRQICKAILENIPEISDCTVYFLLDEYENLLPFQKIVLNTLIKWSASRIFTIKIAAKHTGFRVTKTTEGQEVEEPADYTLIDLDYDVGRKDQRAAYMRLLKQVCEKVLKHEGISVPIDKLLVRGSIAPGIAVKEIEQEVSVMAQEIQGKKWIDIPEKQRDEYLTKFRMAAAYRILGRRQRQFSGFYEFALLSSGIIRTFLELCGMSYYFARARRESTQDAKDSPISQVHQSQAVFALSSYYLATLRKNISDYGFDIQQLVIDFGDIFRHRLLYHPSQPEASRISITDPQNFTLANMKIADNVINCALMHSVMFSPSRGLPGNRPSNSKDIQPTDFILNRIFAPVLRYSPRARWRINVKVSDIEGLLDKKQRGKIKSDLIQNLSGERYRERFQRSFDDLQTKLQ